MTSKISNTMATKETGHTMPMIEIRTAVTCIFNNNNEQSEVLAGCSEV